MIVWLASFPRSGNTLLRQMLNCCFGIQSYSIYNDTSDIRTVPEASEKVGHLSYTGDWQDFRQSAAESKDPVFIKTHDAPIDASKAIYLVRHPLSTAQSYMHYLNHITHTKVDLVDCICGIGSHFPSWGAHLDYWDPLQRTNTLLLKYEDMLVDPSTTLAQLEGFLGRAPTSGWINPFVGLNQLMPAFFRQGDSKPVDATPEQCRLVHFLYSGWMERLGYTENDSLAEDGPWQKTLEEVTRRFHKEVKKLHEDVGRRAENSQELRRWAEKAESRFVEQRDLALEYMRRVQAAEASLARRHAGGEFT